MQKIKSIVFLLFFACCNVCFATPIAETTPKQLQNFTENLGTVSASFKQTKIIPESTKQFISDGYVKFVKNVGFIWHQQKPEENTFTSTLKHYCVNGQKSELSDLPYFHQIQTMIDNMLNGDMSDFLYAFNVDYVEQGKTWTMIATPRLNTIADLVQDLTIYGTDTDLNKIIMTHEDGTITIIEFKKMKTEIKDEIVC